MTELWIKKYNIAKKYYEEHGNLNIPSRYIVKENEENIYIGNWIRIQRNKYKGNILPELTNLQIKLLNDIGMIWDLKEEEKLKNNDWLLIYSLVKKYYEQNGNILIPTGYIQVVNGNIVDLSNWVHNQKVICNKKKNSKLSDEQIKLLEEIGIKYNVPNYNKDSENISDKWYFRYNLAKKYYETHGNLLINSTYEVLTDQGLIKLGIWLNTQRKKYKGTSLPKLNKKQTKLLEEIGMVWSFDDIYDDEWNRKYDLAKKYYETHGNLLITQTYVVTSEKDRINLGVWINTQRMRYKGKYKPVLRQDQIKMLEEIGMIWEVNEYNMKNVNRKWLEKYELAKKYYEEHGNLLISKNYVDVDNGKQINLGTWIATQRMRYKGNLCSDLSQEQIDLLEKIGMIWDVNEYKNMGKFIDEQYMLYERKLLSDDEIIKLLDDGVLVYSDLDEVKKANTFAYYRRNK